MKKVLILAYYFPPLGMGGVQRAAKFAKYLPQFGWDPIIVTVQDIVYYAYDLTLLNELKHCQIHRTDSLDPLRIAKQFQNNFSSRKNSPKQSFKRKTISQRLIYKLCIPDSKIFWLPFAMLKAMQIIRDESIQLIFTTSPPHSVHLLGAYLKKKTGIPWVADLRDSWRVPFDLHSSALDELNLFLAKKSLMHADHVMTVSEPIFREIKEQLEISPQKMTIIPNGFDKEDFPQQIIKKSRKFKLTYCGAMSSEINLESFLQGVSKAVQTWTELKQFIQIKLVGTSTNLDINRSLQRHDILDNTEIVGYVNHVKSIEYLMASDLLILWLPYKMQKGMVTGKLFEYLASGKPILAMLPEGEAKRYILKFKRGVIVSPNDIDQIAQVIYRSFILWKRGDLKLTVSRWNGLREFQRNQQTDVLARLFNDIWASKFICH